MIIPSICGELKTKIHGKSHGQCQCFECAHEIHVAAGTTISSTFCPYVSKSMHNICIHDT